MKDRLYLFLIYAVAYVAGTLVAVRFTDHGILWSAAAGTLAVVVVLYVFSFLMNNSSVFDPYWSIAPLLILLLFWASGTTAWFMESDNPFAQVTFRVWIVALIALVYGIRLTWNFLRGWRGFTQEDWRYVNFRNSSGRLYWLVSLAGIHLFPAVMVFLGTVSLWVVACRGAKDLNLLDLAGILVTSGAIVLESIADNQLRKFNRENPGTDKTMRTGLWGWSRHPNYLGEILFWWGLYLFALAANPYFWWAVIGPAAITLMFLLASIPMMENRLMGKKGDYADYRKRVAVLIPGLKFPTS